jgi:branched-chain amino acid transport system permease protein
VLGGALTAALAGVMAAVYYGNISFGTGMVYGLKVLFLVAAGGLRSPIHAAAGAACFGMAEALWAGYFPIEWRDAWMFGALVVLLVLRPTAQERRPI